ncbi:MAG: hypothetical protein JXA33_19250 [Anaerolineae bacterium]|nr:hypothetical protein [Anaerolineae bacterium]
MEKYRTLWIAALVALLTTGAFIVTLPLRGIALGFPLDDAWIHQTYARNLGLRGEFSFITGRPSAGSTAPLWTLLLVPGHGFKSSATTTTPVPFVWTWLVGLGSLIATSVAGARLARVLFPDRSLVPLLTAVAIAAEWHQVWAAASSMETGLFAAGVLALLAQAAKWGETPPSTAAIFWTGMGVGTLALVRPEGVLLSGILGLALLLKYWPNWRTLIRHGLLLAAGMFIPLMPYMLLNLSLSGTPFPNTFYAKQQEYSTLYAAPFLTRMARLLIPLIAGPLALLLPALLWALPHPRRHPARWLPLIWIGGTWVLYAWRLPVTYQHGRYLMPMIPPLLVYGVGGLYHVWDQARGRLPWLLTRAWAGTAFLITLIFVGIGANTYATDVAIINGEMVNVAHWINENTAPDARIAAHDIGALGYFAQRPLLDLAGLVSPEVIPFIRDEDKLLRWMATQQTEYVITFPSWYPQMVTDSQLTLLYQTDTALTRAMGEDNMAIYRCEWK